MILDGIIEGFGVLDVWFFGAVVAVERAKAGGDI